MKPDGFKGFSLAGLSRLDASKYDTIYKAKLKMRFVTANQYSLKCSLTWSNLKNREIHDIINMLAMERPDVWRALPELSESRPDDRIAAAPGTSFSRVTE